MTTSEIIDLVCKVAPAVISVLCAVIVVIAACKKTGGSIAKVLLSLITKLPAFINDAEEKGFISGKSKLSYVLQLSICHVATLLNISTEEASRTYGNTIETYIENILSTPQKKEVSNEETKS